MMQQLRIAKRHSNKTLSLAESVACSAKVSEETTIREFDLFPTAIEGVQRIS